MNTQGFTAYTKNLATVLGSFDWSVLLPLAVDLRRAVVEKRAVFLCGNGGSAANAVHLANDFIYGIAKKNKQPMRVEALPANLAVLTCLANDVGYGEVFALQLKAKAQKGDILVALSGSGASENVVRALEMAREIGATSYAIVGFDGGKCKELADHAIHFEVNDMQICEDLQAIAGHMLMQWLADCT